MYMYPHPPLFYLYLEFGHCKLDLHLKYVFNFQYCFAKFGR